MTDDFEQIVKIQTKQAEAYRRVLVCNTAVQRAVSEFDGQRYNYKVIDRVNELLVIRNIQGIKACLFKPYLMLKVDDYMVELNKKYSAMIPHRETFLPIIITADRFLMSAETCEAITMFMSELQENLDKKIYTLDNIDIMLQGYQDARDFMHRYQQTWDNEIAPAL